MTDDQWPARPSDTAVAASETVASEHETIHERVPPPLPPEEPDNAIGRGMLLALAALAIAAVGALAAWYLTNRDNKTQTTTVVTTAANGTTAGAAQRIAVPELVGLTEQAALIKLGKAGLQPKVERRQTGPRDGLVVSQRPSRATKIALGSAVTILVDRQKVAAPKVKPKPKPAPPAATSTAATTTAASSTTAATTTAATTTIAAAPAPQPQAKPAPSTATMPDLSGKDEQAAAQALTQAGLFTSIVFVPSDSELGTVEGQGKPAGAKLPAKSTVQINVSRGPGDKPDSSVPDLVGKKIPDAVSALQGVHLRLIMVKTDVPTRDQAGLVVKQTPMPGTKAPQNGQVLVYMGACTTCP